MTPFFGSPSQFSFLILICRYITVAPVIFLKHNVVDEYDEQSEVAERLRIKVIPL
ncbi:hypothetical protein ARALYDRAFT_916860 [Arabidopsis lyrata subsp. lyrata]|uniref:Uncharacterized protein n=1 Tax=Arabidopsis lyrata subsp. lyrata TaxID=81972 RepID=D7MSQ4_ARALL|nr:hypothetical protein ARALYDRAFT_916860 [Arabidopsis lyrata subsp. lyrata]